jgi:hypothetical protein
MSYGTVSLLGSVPPVLPAGATALVGGPSSSTDNAITRWDGATGALLQNSTVTLSDNGDIAIPSAATAGLQLYNTVDQVTNYERLEARWSGNVAIIGTASGGSGAGRQLQIVGGGGGSTLNMRNGGSTQGTFQFSTGSTSTAGAIWANFSGYTNTATSGTNIGLSLTPTYNQASGTAANTDLLINRTQTAVGSGAQLLIDAQVGGVSQFSVSNTGVIAIRNTVAAAVAVASTHKVTISIGGVTYYLLATNVA